MGKIVYSPRSHLGSNEKWAVLMCDDEISKYYRHLYTMMYPHRNGVRIGKLGRPVWGAHISWLRSEYIHNIKLWGLDANKIIEFDYEPGVLDNGTYYWMKVSCPLLLDLREKYGLSRRPKHDLHLTIGVATNN